MDFKNFMEGKKDAGFKASKEDIVKMWQNLQVSPIQATPIPLGHKGTRYNQDGVRITGTYPFINSVLSHLKDLLRFELSPNTKLDIEYRQIKAKSGLNLVPKYVCYVHIEQK